jgi:hypothetical protein
MNKVAAGVEVASAFPRLICQGSARPVPSTRYHLINTPTPPFFIFKTLQIITEPPWEPEISTNNQPEGNSARGSLVECISALGMLFPWHASQAVGVGL